VGKETCLNPMDRGLPRTKCHVLSDANSIPLAEAQSPVSLHGNRMPEAIVDTPPV